MNDKIPVGVSACLLGCEVRFDGGHKRDRFLLEDLSRHFDWIRVCPEVEIGLGTPRESIRLVGRPEAPRLVAPRSGRDLTERMEYHAASRVQGLRARRIRGFVLKKDSPTCGMERVRVWDGEIPVREGQGLFARALTEAWPTLPVEEEGRLNDPNLRDSFLTRVFAYDRWLTFRDGAPDAGGLVAFHTAHKLLLLAHDPVAYRSLGRLVAEQATLGLEEVLDRYEEGFMGALARTASRGRHANVLQHLVGYLKRRVEGEDRSRLLEVIEEYREGWVPLVTPVTLLRETFSRHPDPWVAAQNYLEPHPRDLAVWSAPHR